MAAAAAPSLPCLSVPALQDNTGHTLHTRCGFASSGWGPRLGPPTSWRLITPCPDTPVERWALHLPLRTAGKEAVPRARACTASLISYLKLGSPWGAPLGPALPNQYLCHWAPWVRQPPPCPRLPAPCPGVWAVVSAVLHGFRMGVSKLWLPQQIWPPVRFST